MKRLTGLVLGLCACLGAEGALSRDMLKMDWQGTARVYETLKGVSCLGRTPRSCGRAAGSSMASNHLCPAMRWTIRCF
ncbi:MAG: hypothetical protein Q4G65_07690 [bacterium]|nr:hypothetical protein [bacterium]